MTASQDAGLGAPGDELTVPDRACGWLTLYVAGASELSVRAIAHARALCDVKLGGRYRLAVVDVHDDPAAVLSSRVMVVPTLVKSLPLPERRLVGDLSDTEKVLQALELSVGNAIGPEA
jgi:circadian clock protein KaiB